MGRHPRLPGNVLPPRRPLHPLQPPPPSPLRSPDRRPVPPGHHRRLMAIRPPAPCRKSLLRPPAPPPPCPLASRLLRLPPHLHPHHAPPQRSRRRRHHPQQPAHRRPPALRLRIPLPRSIISQISNLVPYAICHSQFAIRHCSLFIVHFPHPHYRHHLLPRLGPLRRALLRRRRRPGRRRRLPRPGRSVHHHPLRRQYPLPPPHAGLPGAGLWGHPLAHRRANRRLSARGRRAPDIPPLSLRGSGLGRVAAAG